MRIDRNQASSSTKLVSQYQPKPKKQEPTGFFGFLKQVFTFDFGSSEPSGPVVARDLRSTKTPILVAGPNGFSTRTAADMGELGKSAPPGPDILRQIAELDRPTVIAGRLGDQRDQGAYGIVLPPRFDPNRAYEVRRLEPPSNASTQDVLQELAKSPPTAANTVFIVSEADLAEKQLFAQIHEDYGLDLSKYSSGKLTERSENWSSQIQTGMGFEPVRIHGPVLSNGRGDWIQWPETTDHELRFPAPTRVSKTEAIPESVQKQPKTHGSFFSPVLDSKAIGSQVRLGVYLPPGYDPSSAEKYPVLVMLPGRGSPLSHWTSAGQLIPKLDEMMQGDAQKMIVVIPDGNDSYFVNEEGKKGKKFQDLVTKELVGYATKELKGDRDQLALAGISRGGYGAMVAASQHPKLFKSVSSHSGALGEARGEGAKDNPTRLAEQGAFDDKGPRLRVDIGAGDPYFVDETVDFLHILSKQGVEVDARVLDPSDQSKGKHNWNLWASSLEDWIGFHQASFGKPGTPSDRLDAKNIAAEKLDVARSRDEAAWGKFDKDIARASQTADGLESKLAELDKRAPQVLDGLGAALPIDALRGELSDARAALKTATAFIELRKTAVYSPKTQGEAIEQVQSLVRGLEDEVASVGATLESLAALPKGMRADVWGIVEKVPTLQGPLFELTRARPQLFEKPDGITGKLLSEQLRDFVQNHLEKKEVLGFAEFLTRLKDQTYNWKVGGWSHSVCASLTTWMNHPGLVLDLVTAAKEDRPYPLPHIYDGDGPDALRPTPDLANAFLPVRGASRDGSTFVPDNASVVRGSALGYERGLLLAVVNELHPPRLTEDRPGARCAPVAVALSRLTGADVRYGYAFNLQTGDDLKKAMDSQNGLGIAMADIEFSVDGGAMRFSHFPVFYDYNPKTNTCMFQDFGQAPPKSISLDKLRFVDQGSRRPAIYYVATKGIEPYLTLDEMFKGKKPPAPTDARWGEKMMQQSED